MPQIPYPVDTVVRLINTNEFAIVRKLNFLKDGKYFLNYLCEIEGRKTGGLYCVFHDDVQLECLPESTQQP